MEGYDMIEEEFDEEVVMLKADGFDEAIIGSAERCGLPVMIAYDWDKCVDILRKRDGMSLTEAIEFMDFNVTGAYMGEGTPVFIKGMGPRCDCEVVNG
tara:strand:+ start:122 stop:415 length:294 start_codon:yes stop_codon:yes gene_type:complete